jgi:hypothetical protein
VVDNVGPLLVWSLIGAALFSVYVVLVFRTGIVYTARHSDGTLKKRVSLSGLLNSGLLVGMIAGLQVAALLSTFRGAGDVPRYGRLYAFAYALYLVLGVYDTAVIDYLVIVKWRPGFLKLPDEMNADSMRRHILASIPVVLLAGLALTAVSALIARWIL